MTRSMMGSKLPLTFREELGGQLPQLLLSVSLARLHCNAQHSLCTLSPHKQLSLAKDAHTPLLIV